MGKILKIKHLALFLTVLADMALMGGHQAFGAELKVLRGHVPSVVPNLVAAGDLPSTNLLHLAIGLPMRDRAGLDKFVAQVSDPASPLYRQYLTREELTARFGPTEADYQSVINFARTNGFTITARHGTRLLLDVTAPTASIEKAFHIKLRTYHHPAEARDFFAPDTEPSVDATLPVVDVQGISDYYRPHPMLVSHAITGAGPKTGSAPDGSGGYFGNDFINAYAPGTTLTGAGQTVGLLEFDGFYASDIAAYAANAGNGRTNITIQPVLLEQVSGFPGYSGIPDADAEVSLDIEMAISMAPGLSAVKVYEGATQNGVLTGMLEDSNTVYNMSSSWGWAGGPSDTTDVIFESMGAVGESFFSAAGDSDAYTTGAASANGVDNPGLQNAPASNPYITIVGGTTLTMNGTGASYASETVWNWGYDANAGQYVGTGGGISSYYNIPSWQTGVTNLIAAGGSTSFRNLPDVALTADNVYVEYNDGTPGNFGGTSCAAPLWAGFMALVNQQAAANGRPPMGFVNPALYTILAGTNYSACFNDVTTGSNISSASPDLFYATNGYDLCTGLGTPNGPNLIPALAGWPDSIQITPVGGFAASGPLGGPFTGASANFTLYNAGSSNLTWTLSNLPSWLSFTPPSGVLTPGQTTNVSVILAPAASSLPIGSYSASVSFADLTTGIGQPRKFTLQVLQPLAVLPGKGFTAVSAYGGSFDVTSENFVLTNLGSTSLKWSVVHTPSWLNVAPISGSLAAGGSTPLTASLNATATTLGIGSFTDELLFTNQNGGTAELPFTVQINPILINGGFETGDFTGWTLTGNSGENYVTSAADFAHSGHYGAALGQAYYLAFLTQMLNTTPGQQYLVSFWLENAANPYGYTPNQFIVYWNTTNLYSQANLPFMNWTNLQYVVTATNTNSMLRFEVNDNPYYLGLDDVSVTPLVAPSLAAATTGNGVTLSWNTLSGLGYQVQYTTNLANPNWINLGPTQTATNNTLSMSLSNSPPVVSQRFYRLLLVP